MGNQLSPPKKPLYRRSYSDDFQPSRIQTIYPSASSPDGFKVTSADQSIHNDLSRLKLNLFSMECLAIMTSRLKKLFASPTISTPEVNGGGAEATRHKRKKVGSRSKSVSSAGYGPDETTGGSVQSGQSKPSRSPFSIRRVKPVKPEKIAATMNNNNGNSPVEVVKKRSSFLRRKSSGDAMTDRNLNLTSESRMVIRRARSPSTVTRPLSTGLRSPSLGLGSRLNSFGSVNEFHSSSYERYRKKNSVPSRPLDYTTGSDFDPQDIERRRRRIRSINNLVPPLPVSSRYRGYLSFNDNNDMLSSASRKSSRASMNYDATTSNSLDAAGATFEKNKNGEDTTNTLPKQDANNNYARPFFKAVDIDFEDESGASGASDNEKSSYASINDRRTLWRASKSDKVFNDIKQQSENGQASPSKQKKSGRETSETGADLSRVNGDTKTTEIVIQEPEGQVDNLATDAKNDCTSSPKNVLNLSINISDRSDIEDSDMENSGGIPHKTKRSASLKAPKSAPLLERKSSHPDPVQKSPHSKKEQLPDLSEAPKTPNNSLGRLKRDYHLTETEITALRGIMKKADMYDQTVRERLFQVLKIDKDTEENLDEIVAKVVSDKEIETLKQRLFMSRKELDSYISFTKKMEREKRQFQSEKEELETKIQWHERRLNRFETENKSLKTERANMMNQIYELRSKSSSINKDTGNVRQKSMDVSQALTEQSKLESSKQRFIHEADVFAQERTKLIKERQRLDEDNRKAHIRNVSLIAQVQHWEKTVKELEVEKEELKNRLSKMSRQSVDDQRKLIHESSKDLADSGLDVSEKDHNYNCLIETIKFDDSEITRLRKELEDLEAKHENLKNEYRNIEENQITIDHENMALKDTVNVLQNAKEEADSRLNEVDKKYHETMTELKTITLSSEELEKENIHLQKEFEHVSASLSELQRDAVDMESDQDSFKKFLDKLSMELQEKLGEEHVSKDTEAESLQEQAEIIGRQVVAHLNPSRKLQEDYEALKIDKDDLEEEIKFLKFALSNRMEIKTLQAPVQKCECSKEKAALKRDYEDALSRLEALEDEVTRLHQDKQQLLMSFLNLQASTRSRDVSKSGMATDDDLSDEETETERESDYDTDIASRSVATSSNAGSLSDIKIEDEDDKHAPVIPHPPVENEGELKAKLEEAYRTIQRLESERIEMLDSLCQQADNNNTLNKQLEDLRNGSDRPGSRCGSQTSGGIPKSESMVSITSEKCMNCLNSGDEIRSYLSIIEELTEDKLRLEKSLNDLELEKEKYERDLEKMTENYCKMENEMVMVDSEKESTVRSAKEETILLLKNVQSLREENTLLEENLQQLDEDRREVLQNLKQAEEDRLGFIRTLQLISEQKETVEERMEQLQVENEELKSKLKEREGSVCTLTPLDLKGTEHHVVEEFEEVYNDVKDSKENDSTNVDNTENADEHLHLGRSQSTPSQANAPHSQLGRTLSTSLQSPKEFPIRRTNSIENINENTEDNFKEELQDQVSSLRKEVGSYKELNKKLKKSLEYANSLLTEEKKWNLQLLSERGFSPISSPITNERKTLADDPAVQDLDALETISETGASGKQVNIEPRRLSFERRRSEEFKNSERQTPEEARSKKPPPMERRNSIAEEEIIRRRRVYGQRKPSMSLDEMFDMFGVHNSLQSPATPSPNVSKDSSPTLSRAQSSAETFEVSQNGVPLDTEKDI